MNAINIDTSSSRSLKDSSSKSSWAKRHALISYCVMAIGLFTAVPIVLGAIWALVKRGNFIGTIYHSHYTNAITVFWWSLLWTIIGAIFSFVLIGYAMFAIVWLWAIYRLVNGIAKIINDEPYPI